jgi:hypothetical protein
MLTWQDDNPYILNNIFCRIYLSTTSTFDEFELQIWYTFDGVEKRAQGTFAAVSPGVLRRKVESFPSRWQQCVADYWNVYKSDIKWRCAVFKLMQ